ncbi:hypothetical protein [Dyella sedimenti]|uniref:hypothetical protein n=1 Tax=Dyella sedimenti TaxID=2919947 RepID=UPI001FA958AB|nr:hypothetical protein [Dyella sedimenti]
MTNESSSRGFLEAGWHISYMIYHATGEGVRICIAVAASQEYAEEILKSKIDGYFYRAIKSSLIAADRGDEVKRMLQWIPDAVKKSLGEMPLGAGEYYAELYYNLG